jgi:hypothetical protein
MTPLAIAFKLTLTLLVVIVLCVMASETLWKSQTRLMPAWFVIMFALTFILFVLGVAATFLLLIWTV